MGDKITMRELENHLTQHVEDHFKNEVVAVGKEFTYTETSPNRSISVRMKGYSEEEVKSIINEVLNYE